MHNRSEHNLSKGFVKQGVRALSRQIGRNIYELRSANRISLKKLSCKTQINRDYLEKIEIGACTVQFYHIVRIANAFNIPPEKLLFAP